MWLLVTLWHKVTLPFESTISSMNCIMSITFTLPWSGVQAVERLQILKRVWWRWVEIPGRVCSALCNVHMTRSQNNDTFLFQRVLKILTACRILQISIAWCHIEGEIHSFPTMYFTPLWNPNVSLIWKAVISKFFTFLCAFKKLILIYIDHLNVCSLNYC